MTDATKASEVAERLEAYADHADHTALKYDRIQQRALYDEFRAKALDLRAAASLIRAQSERERVLVEALKPFAAHADLWAGSIDGQAVFTSLRPRLDGDRDWAGNLTITVGDLRRAQATGETK